MFAKVIVALVALLSVASAFSPARLARVNTRAMVINKIAVMKNLQINFNRNFETFKGDEESRFSYEIRYACCPYPVLRSCCCIRG